MQKLPEASDRKKGWRMRKEKETSRQQWPAELHLNLPAAREANVTALRRHVGLNLSLVATVSVNSMPKYKKLRNGPIELRTKQWTWTNSQKRLTRCWSFKILNEDT